MVVKTNANYAEALVFKKKSAVACKFSMVSLGWVDNASRNSSYEPKNIVLQISQTPDISNLRHLKL